MAGTAETFGRKELTEREGELRRGGVRGWVGEGLLITSVNSPLLVVIYTSFYDHLCCTHTVRYMNRLRCNARTENVGRSSTVALLECESRLMFRRPQLAGVYRG